MDVEQIIVQAHEDGRVAGVAAGSWVIDGNTTAETVEAILKGLEDGDPAVYDMLPSNPLSGEWADAPTPESLLRDYAGSSAWDGVFTDEQAEEILDAFEQGFSEGVQDEVIRSCRAVL